MKHVHFTPERYVNYPHPTKATVELRPTPRLVSTHPVFSTPRRPPLSKRGVDCPSAHRRPMLARRITDAPMLSNQNAEKLGPFRPCFAGLSDSLPWAGSRHLRR